MGRLRLLKLRDIYVNRAVGQFLDSANLYSSLSFCSLRLAIASMISPTISAHGLQKLYATVECSSVDHLKIAKSFSLGSRNCILHIEQLIIRSWSVLLLFILFSSLLLGIVDLIFGGYSSIQVLASCREGVRKVIEFQTTSGKVSFERDAQKNRTVQNGMSDTPNKKTICGWSSASSSRISFLWMIQGFR